MKVISVFILLSIFASPCIADIQWTGPVTVKEVRVDSGNVYVRFNGATTNFYAPCSTEWSVYPSSVIDLDRILSVLLTAKTTGSDIEVGVHDNDCHSGFRRLESIWMK